MADWIITQRLGVSGCNAQSPMTKEAFWNFPLKGWLKCNNDGSAFPGLATVVEYSGLAEVSRNAVSLWELAFTLPLELR